MSSFSAIGLVIVTRDNNPHFQPGSILSKQTACQHIICIIQLVENVPPYSYNSLYFCLVRRYVLDAGQKSI